jgi:hypothetical protein
MHFDLAFFLEFAPMPPASVSYEEIGKLGMQSRGKLREVMDKGRFLVDTEVSSASQRTEEQEHGQHGATHCGTFSLVKDAITGESMNAKGTAIRVVARICSAE